MTGLTKSFIISSNQLNISTTEYREQQFGKFYFTSFSENLLIPNKEQKVYISLENLSLIKQPSSLKQNYICMEESAINIIGSDMNTQPIYYIYLENQNRFVIFNDLFLAKDILKSLKCPLDYNNKDFGEDLTFFKNIQRLRYGQEIQIFYKENSLNFTLNRFSNILGEVTPQNYSIDEAKKHFFNALYHSVKELTEGHEKVYVSLSGGIDSGTITYILKQLNKKVYAFSLGTDWGNEYKEAQETADYLGIELHKIHLNKEEILSEIPNVIRYFGFIDNTSIEVALVGFCLYKKLIAEGHKDMVFVTGYGSDLLNAGIYSDFSEYDQLSSDIINRLKRTRISNEFSNLSTLNMGIKTIHPFWHTDVITEALRIPADYKVIQGKDKFFFRDLMASKLPYSIAWRTKKGAHQGTGLTNYLESALEDAFFKITSRKEEYKNILKELHNRIFLFGDYPVSLRDLIINIKEEENKKEIQI